MFGCVVTASPPPAHGVLVTGPPPAAIREERPPPPVAQAAWIGGYWHWTGLQYAWIPGHWEIAPPLGATWHAPSYVQSAGGFFYEPGGWTAAPATRPAAAPTVEAFH